MAVNPFQPWAARPRALRRPMTVRAFLDSVGIAEFATPTICLLNGEPLLRACWARRRIGRGDVCAFVALPGKVGGGGGGKNPLNAVLSIAVMVAAPYIAGVVAPELAFGAMVEGAIGKVGFNTIAFGLVKGAAALAGAALVNLVVPPPRPNVPGLPSFGTGSVPSPSPTYTHGARANAARIGQPIPEVFGRHIVYPDHAAQPWREFVANEEFVHWTLVIGKGAHEIERLAFGDDPFDSFAEVTTEVLGPGEDVTLFDPDVVTSESVSGQELLAPNEEGGGAWLGPFAACGPRDTVHRVGIDIVAPRGLYFANASGGFDPRTANWEMAAREIDTGGAPVGDWFTLTPAGGESATAATNTPQRLSFAYEVAPARCEVRARRIDDKDLDARAGHALAWAGLRGHITAGLDLAAAGVTALAVRARASNNLNAQVAGRINAIVVRRLPAWDSGTDAWTEPVATRSIAWAFAQVAMSANGGRLRPALVDLDGLAALDSVLEARGDRFDAVFDQPITAWEGLTRIARCGRAVPVPQAGRLMCVRDGPKELPAAHFGPRNIVKGSFSIEFLLPGDETASAVEAMYFDSRTWTAEPALAVWEGADATRPARIPLFGVTDEAHALREAGYEVRANVLRRVVARFMTEMAGLIPLYGDLVSVTHPLPRWGTGGEVLAWDAAAGILTLSEPVSFAEGEDHFIALRRRDGTLATPVPCEAVEGRDDHVHVLEALPLVPYTGGDELRTMFSFGPGEDWTGLCRLIHAMPRARHLIEIVAVLEDDRVHET